MAIWLIGGMLGWTVHEAQIQHEAVAAITRAGGTVYYDWEMRKDGLILYTTKTGWTWSLSWSASITSATLPGSTCSEGDRIGTGSTPAVSAGTLRSPNLYPFADLRREPCHPQAVSRA